MVEESSGQGLLSGGQSDQQDGGAQEKVVFTKNPSNPPQPQHHPGDSVVDMTHPANTDEIEPAIQLNDCHTHYGLGRNKTPVLMGLDMRVERGQIYGLLGPSGCGKTTLLKCIVGKLKVDSGQVLVFGTTPGSHPGVGVPGSRVGYMPQELAIFGEFNIEETLTYFRRIFGMTRKKYEERLEFLMKFLDLPSRKRALQNMSGGQQRRASLAVALLHEPELLILDEPTVGVDPLLRTSIWAHLMEMSGGSGSNNNISSSNNRKRCTIVITTHYIEEARQASRVGMMRFGKLLAEDSPEVLLQRYMKNSLEDVFLELCLQDGDLETAKVRNERKGRDSIIKNASKTSMSNMLPWKNKDKDSSSLEGGVEVTPLSDQQQQQQQQQQNNGDIKSNGHAVEPTAPSVEVSEPEKSSTSCCSPAARAWYLRRKKAKMSTKKVTACMLKTFTRMRKRIGFLIYQFVLPALQVSLFCLAIGQDPRDLPVAVVNLENNGEPCKGHPTQCPLEVTFTGLQGNDHLQNFSCRYLSFLDTSIAQPVFYRSIEEATIAVQHGEAWGVVYMDANFTTNLKDRIFESMTSEDPTQIDRDLFNKSSIRIRMDVTNQHIAFTLQLKFVEAFEKFMKQLISSCNMPEELASIPLVFDAPVYGTHELTFTDFMAPGIILTIVHSMALGYSAMIIIMERNEGLMDRTWVAGVTPGEFALAHFLVSLVVNLLQVVVTLIFMIFVFAVPNEGSFFLVFLLTMLQGICGTTIGLIISAVCQTQQDATQIALGIFYPNLIMSGIIWPIQSMPAWLRYISYFLPQTFACQAMRGILMRGWDLTYMPVYRGFAVTIAWILVTYIVFRRIVIHQN